MSVNNELKRFLVNRGRGELALNDQLYQLLGALGFAHTSLQARVHAYGGWQLLLKDFTRLGLFSLFPKDGSVEGSMPAIHPQYLFLDSARTTPITAPGDPVGGATDLSGNGNHFEQTVDADRMIYGRVPVGGRRNNVVNSAFLGAASGSPGTQPTDWGRQTNDGTLEVSNYDNNNNKLKLSVTSARQWFSQNYSVQANTVYNFSVIFDETSGLDINQIFTFGSFPTGSSFTYFVGGIEVSGGSSAPESSFVLTCVLTTGSTGGTAGVRLGAGVSSNATGFAAFALPQFEVGDARSQYQRVGNQFDVTEAGVQSVRYLATNYTNQKLPNSIPAGTYTIAIAGTNGIWFDEIAHAGGAFDLGPTTYPGGPEDILEVLGNFIGWTYREGAISATRIKAYYKSLGSPGVFVLGDDKVVNGTFDPVADGVDGHDNGDGTVDGYTRVGSSHSVVDNKLRVSGDGASSNRSAIYPIATTPGKDYIVQVDLALVSGGATQYLIASSNNSDGSANFDFDVFAPGNRRTLYFEAQQEVTYISLRNDGSNASTVVDWDNFSAQELELIP